MIDVLLVADIFAKPLSFSFTARGTDLWNSDRSYPGLNGAMLVTLSLPR